MKNNKGFIGIGLIIAIIVGAFAIGGGAYYVGKVSKTTEPTKVEENNFIQEEQNQNGVVNTPAQNNTGINQNVPTNANTKTTTNQIPQNPQQNYYTYSSTIYGYSINYTGNVSPVPMLSGGFSLMQDQSTIDGVDIVNYPYAVPNYFVSVGNVSFGANQYQKFKDNITTRHTYYLKSGLQNNKALLISVEGNSDNPSFLDLSSLVISANPNAWPTTQ